MNVTTDNFQDYGIIDWFDQSKGFGVVQSVRNGEVFIHKKHGISGEAEERKIALIGSISIDTYRNNRVYGNDVGVWNGDEEAVYDLIHKKFIKNALGPSLLDIKWLINYGTLNVNQKLIDKLNTIEGFEKELLNDIYINRHRLKGAFDAIIIKKWISNAKPVYDFYLKSLFKTYNQNTFHLALSEENLWEILSYNDEWLLDQKFQMIFKKVNTSNQAYIIHFLISHTNIEHNKERFNFLLRNAKHDLLHSYLTSNFDYFIKIDIIADCLTLFSTTNTQLFKLQQNFLLNYWKLSNGLTYNNIVDWLLKNSDEFFLRDLFKFNYLNWITDECFISAVKSYFPKSFYRDYTHELPEELVYKVWENKKMAIYDSNLEWLINNSESAILDSIILLFKAEWKKNDDFIIKLRTRFPSSKAIIDFFYEVWSQADQKEYDKNINYLILHGDENIIAKLIGQNERFCQENAEFIEMVKKHQHQSTTVINFILELWSKDMTKNENFIWLIERQGINEIKTMFKLFTGYDERTINSIYTSLFPNSDERYYEKRSLSMSRGSSADFREIYLDDRQEKIKSRFRDLFVAEFDSKSGNMRLKPAYKKEIHSATDLANFTYCPASYILSQNYDLNFSEQENIYVGQQEHEKNRLLDIKKVAKSKHSFYMQKNPMFEQLTISVRAAECIFSGHKEDIKNSTPFYSKNKKLSSIPDYIFQDKNGIFIVEEKYTFKKPEQVNNLYDNHKIQALTYLYGLSDYQPYSAYVCYWFIEKEKDEYKITGAKAFKLVRSEENKQTLLKAYNSVEALQNRESLPFSPHQINHNKCVRCNYFPYCDYKSGEKKFVELPAIEPDSKS